MLHFQHFLVLYINSTGEPVQDPQAFISGLFYIANT